MPNNVDDPKQTSTALSVTDMRALAGDCAKSRYFADALDISQAVVKIQAGAELGFPPIYSMTKIYIVEGKITVSAEGMGALVKRSGRYDYSVKTLTDTECSLQFTDNGSPVYLSKFDIKDATRAGLVKQRGGWEKWPRAMLMSKALSQGARIVCPHVIAGAYTPEDFGVQTNADGEPVSVSVSVEPGPEPAPPTPATEPPPIEMITAAQRRKIFATGHEHGYPDEAIKALLMSIFGLEHTSDLTRNQAGQFIEAIERGDEVPETAEDLREQIRKETNSGNE